MTVNIEKIAKAAAIVITSEEKEIFQPQIESIIDILCQLKTVDTTGVEPLMTVYHGNLRLREDIAVDPKSGDTVMQSANNARYNYFVTPKFVE